MGDTSEEEENKEGLATQQWQPNDEHDGDFSMSASVPMWDRLDIQKQKTVPSPAARDGSTRTTQASNRSTTTQISRWQVGSSTTDAVTGSFSFGSTKKPPAHSTSWAMYVGDSDYGGKRTGRVAGEGIPTNLGPACRVDAGGNRFLLATPEDIYSIRTLQVVK